MKRNVAQSESRQTMNEAPASAENMQDVLSDLESSGMVLQGDVRLGELIADRNKSVKAQLIYIVSQGRMRGVHICRDSKRFDPAELTSKLSAYGFSPLQVSRFMRNLYQTPAQPVSNG